MISAEFVPIANHVWQSTLFAGAAALLTLALRRNSAHVRYAVWLAASYKFLIPFSWLVSIGHVFEWRSAPPVVPQAIATVTNAVSAPAFLMPSATVTATPAHSSFLPAAIWCTWACGFLLLTAGWALQWWRIRRMVKRGTRLDFALPIPVVSVSSQLEPGVFGIFRPVLLLPERIGERLAPEQLRAVIAHELCHVRRRDNLAAAIHMLVEALFWFHPLVWWLDGRIIDERERACDEEVLRMGGDPSAYVETILAVCKSYLAAPVACVSGISGSDLKKRIVRIMSARTLMQLTWREKILLSAAALCVVAAPVLLGQLQTASFAVASIRLNDSDKGTSHYSHYSSTANEGTLVATNELVRDLIMEAYAPSGKQLQSNQLIGGPAWINAKRYDINAKVDDSVLAAWLKLPQDQQVELMQSAIQNLLADRFKLVVATEKKDSTVYSLVVASGGPKLTPAKPLAPGETPPPDRKMPGAQSLYSRSTTMDRLAYGLSRQPIFSDGIVTNETGITGNYEIFLHWRGGGDTSEPDIFSALQEELGLRIEAKKIPVDTIVIQHIEEPSPN